MACSWTFSLLGIILVAKISTNITLKSQQSDLSMSDLQKKHLIFSLLENVYSMSIIIDSKFIGLILFLVANISTGLVNLSITTENCNSFISLVILHAHAFFSVGISFYMYIFLNKNTNRDSSDRIEI